MDLATLMFISYRSMDQQVMAAIQAAGFDITPAQGRLAQRIAPEGSRLTDLAAQAQVTKQTASQLVASLESIGLVERIPDPADGRARLIRITPAGLAAAEQAGQKVAEVEASWVQHLGPELSDSLRAALTKLREITDPYADRA